MIRNIALALAIAAITTSAAAQSSRKQPTWDDLLKPVEVKTNPNVPVAPPRPAEPLSLSTRILTGQSSALDILRERGYSTTPPMNPNTKLLDACIISAIGRLPNANGLRVTNSSYEFDHSFPKDEFWTISISVDLHGRQARYVSKCRIRENYSAELVR